MKTLRNLFLCLAIMALPFCACAETSEIDYSQESNWAYYAVSPEKDADLFLICPTVDMGKAGNLQMSMADEETKAAFVGALNMERGIYDEKLTLYAPFYRQAAFPVYSLDEDAADEVLDAAYEDVRAAFSWYLEESPADRPFVLAGFSQGADMMIRLMKEFMDDPACQNRLIAAYCIGWRVTDADLDECPWLKPASGEDDLGVIVCINSEAEGVEDSLMVPAGTKTAGINPLNWKTDDTPADASLNKGACFTDYEGSITREIPQLTGAYLDSARGTLKATDINPADYSNSLFPDGVYHLYDYQFFYRNLQENVSLRVDTYLNVYK